MRIACLVLLAAVTPVAARPHAPVPPRVDAATADLVHVLAGEYGEGVRAVGRWNAKLDDTAPAATGTREICADSGVLAEGRRLVAVCTTYPRGDVSTRGTVDLWSLEPTPGRRARSHVRARFRGLGTGAHGAPGPVRFFDVGPGRRAFALIHPYAGNGWVNERTALYEDVDGRIRQVLDIGTRADDTGTCPTDRARDGRTCRAKSFSLTCTLHVDTRQAPGGYYPLVLQVAGMRGGKPVDRVIVMPRDAYGYRVAARVLQRDACEQSG